MDLNTRGRSTSEFTLTVAAMLAGAIILALKSWLGWELSEEDTALVHQLSIAAIGLVVSYTLGRSWFKGQKARALGELSAEGGQAGAEAAKVLTAPPARRKK